MMRLFVAALALAPASGVAAAAPSCSPGFDDTGATLAGDPLQLPPGANAMHCQVMCQADPRGESYSFYSPGCAAANSGPTC